MCKEINLKNIFEGLKVLAEETKEIFLMLLSEHETLSNEAENVIRIYFEEYLMSEVSLENLPNNNYRITYYDYAEEERNQYLGLEELFDVGYAATVEGKDCEEIAIDIHSFIEENIPIAKKVLEIEESLFNK